MFDLTEALKIPVVRDRLGKGLALHQFDELMQFYERARSDQYLLKTYGGMMQDLEFLRSVGATNPPQIQSGCVMSTSYHWVAIKGYYSVNPYWLQEEGIQQRLIVNTPSLYVPILTLSDEAWRVFYDLYQYRHSNTQTALFYYLYLLDVLKMMGMTYEEYCHTRFVEHTIYNTDMTQIMDHVYSRLEHVLEGDSCAVVPKLLDGQYCMPCSQWLRAGSCYHNILVPSWTLTSRAKEDLTGNRINQWDFFLSSS